MAEPNPNAFSLSESPSGLPEDDARRRRAWAAALIASLVAVVVAVVTLRAMGRAWWCKCATPHVWVGGVWSMHNSQHLLDPYTISHVLHGLVFYWVLSGIARGRGIAVGFVLAIAIEAAWEVLENTNWIIDRYRDSTIALEYYGDSVVNSVADIAACALGYGLAAWLPVWMSVGGFALVEAVMLLSIRDSLLLNVLMLVWPVDAIRQWQIGG